jgi:peptidoglycan/xylan/chitin deacetylase (PgdA/CDA1 family)
MITLLLHDVVDAGDGPSGFSGVGADHYRLTSAHLRRLLELCGTALVRPGATDAEQLPPLTTSPAVLFSFDDGGIGALRRTAPLLESFGARGAFFVPSQWTGKPAFLDAAGLRSLVAGGHLVGTHTFSHPRALSRLPLATIEDEWRRGRDALEQAIGHPVQVGSVPGGFYSRRVAAAAAGAGLTDLFTSEPHARMWTAHGIRIWGRFAVTSWTADREVAEILSGSITRALRLQVSWNARKVAKTLAGPLWFRVREALLRART